MFDSSYKFSQVGSNKVYNQKYLKEVITYSFRSGHYYLVEVEVYSFNIYIIKYYLKKNKSNPLKFNLLTNERKCSRIIYTCINILYIIYQKNPFASFGFIGAYTVIKEINYVEPKATTKRFRVYRDAIIRLFGIQTFSHFQDHEHSAYLMISNQNKNVDLIKENAKLMFNDLFPALED